MYRQDRGWGGVRDGISSSERVNLGSSWRWEREGGWKEEGVEGGGTQTPREQELAVKVRRNSCGAEADLHRESNYLQTSSAGLWVWTRSRLIRWRAWDQQALPQTNSRETHESSKKRGRVKTRRRSRGLWNSVGTASCTTDCGSPFTEQLTSGNCDSVHCTCTHSLQR